MNKPKRNGYIGGVGSLQGGEYRDINIGGIGKLKSGTIAETVEIGGMFKSVGQLKANHVNISGLARIFASIQARSINISGVLKVRRASLSADEIHCSGVLVCNREVNGDYVQIDGFCSIAQLCGTNIQIRSTQAPLFTGKSKVLLTLLGSYLGRQINSGNSLVDLIECETLNAEGLQVKAVHAQKAVFKNGCHIGTLSCTEYEADESCVIDRIITGSAAEKQLPAPTMPKSQHPQAAAIEAMYQKKILTRIEADAMTTALGESENES